MSHSMQPDVTVIETTKEQWSMPIKMRIADKQQTSRMLSSVSLSTMACASSSFSSRMQIKTSTGLNNSNLTVKKKKSYVKIGTLIYMAVWQNNCIARFHFLFVVFSPMRICFVFWLVVWAIECRMHLWGKIKKSFPSLL